MQSARQNLPTTLAELNTLFCEDNVATIKLIAQNPSVAHLVTFDYFCRMAWDISQGRFLQLASIPSVNRVIDSEEKFIQICNASFDTALHLLKYPHIARIAEPIIPFMPSYYLQQNRTRIKKKILSSTPSMLALDLAESKTNKEVTDIEDRKFSLFEKAALNDFDEKSLRQSLPRISPSLKKYCDLMMYGPSGYYTTGKVDFAKHFYTFASDPTSEVGFSAAMANQLFHIRNKLIADQKLKPSDPFNVLECGGGNGDLCYHILETIKQMSLQSSEWKPLFLSIRYHLVDVSPELVKRQRIRTKKFASLVKVIQGNALGRIPELADTKMAAVLSNELLDMFAPQEIILTTDGNIHFSVMVPIVIRYASRPYFAQALKQTDLSLEELIADSERYKTLHIHFIPEEERVETKENLKDCLLLSEASFLKLHQVTAKEKKCPDLFNFMISRMTDADCDGELSKFLKRNPTYTDRMREGKTTRYPDIGIHAYLQSMYKLLIPGGEIISIDYGDTDSLVLETMRTFAANGQIDINFRAQPGFKDITKFVNFSTLAREGELLNFETVFYGRQEQLKISDFPMNVVSYNNRIFFSTNCKKNDGFRVMVQRKSDEEKSTANQSSELSSRFVGASLPVSHSQLFADVRDRTRQINRQIKIDRIVQKYSLTNDSQASLQKALRQAAANGDINDVKLLISLVEDINARDSNLKVKRTALHWAAIKGHEDCYQALLKAGADPDLIDKAEKKTAYQYRLEYKSKLKYALIPGFFEISSKSELPTDRVNIEEGIQCLRTKFL